jgi:type III restriction enzyme
VTDPYTIRQRRRDSAAPLVTRVRAEVDAWRTGGWPGVSGTTRRLLEHWFLDQHESEPGVPFRWYAAQREAVETLIYLHEVAGVRTTADLVTRFAERPVAAAGQPYPRYVVKMATGSGKTKVMSLAVTWAYFHALREPGSPLSSTSIVIAPNLIVMERLREDFEHARVWRSDPLVPPEWRGDFDLQVCLRDDPVPAAAPGVLALTNVQALYERESPPPPNPLDVVLGSRPPARLDAPPPLLHRVAARGRLVVVNDEAHHLHDEVKADTGEPLKVWTTIHRLHELTGDGVVAQLDFSATPKDNQGRLFAETVVDYPLAQAIEDGIVKRPVIGELSGAAEVASANAAVRYRSRLTAGVEKWREFRERLAPSGKRPLLFVMAEDTRSADQIADWLGRLPDLAGGVLTIHINTRNGEIVKADLEKARTAVREVDRDDSPYSAIVSVLMLREGWDVRNVTVIVPLRALTSKNRILPEQALGRGLRRMTPPGSGVAEQVVVVEHEAFRKLWDDALDDPEYEGVEREDLDHVEPTATVVAVEPERLDHDIAIPQLSRLLTRTASGVAALRVQGLPARQLPLADTLRAETVEYTGRDLLSGAEVDRATYPLDQQQDPVAVLAWYVDELQRRTRLTGQFAVLAPLVKGWLEEKAFGGPVDFDDPLVLQALAEPAVQEAAFAVLVTALDEATLETQRVTAEPAKEILLSATRPFLWSGETASADRSVFNVQPCDSGLEVQFCGFLDRCDDVAAFAKLAREVRFSLEYRGEGGRLAYYYPDFVVRLTDGEHLVVETKGRADLDVPAKDERARRWAVDATLASGTRWSYVRVDQEVFEEQAPRVSSLRGLVGVVEARRRERLLGTLDGLPPEPTPGAAVVQMREMRERLRGVSGADEELRRFRDEPRG